ncbi:MAG: TIGR04552 family protein [Myxococcota bacterium]
MAEPAVLRSVRPLHPVSDVVPLTRFDLHDIESVRLLLRGSSVVDWVSLHFSEDEDIDAFLRVNGYDSSDPKDQMRLLVLKRRAAVYLEEHLKYRVPEAIREASDIRWLFRAASSREGRRVHRFYACITLKVMHIIHHSDAHELLSMVQVSQAELAVLQHAKIERAVRGFLERSFPIVEFSGNLKTPYSIYSKLLAKKDTQSALIFDKLRFRFVLERLEDIPPLLLALSRELLPFNYVVPGQSHNSLVDLYRMLVRAGNANVLREKDDVLNVNEPLTTDVTGERRNEFSGPDYRVVNFVADVPLRVDKALSLSENLTRELGPLVFGAVEFQIVDVRTAEDNESGENRHALYKARQRVMVRQRLERGRRAARVDGKTTKKTQAQIAAFEKHEQKAPKGEGERGSGSSSAASASHKPRSDR